jgi:hypothetical protein
MGKPELQSLFEKVADQYEGTVEQKHVTDEYVDLQFLKDSNDGPVEVGHVRLSLVEMVAVRGKAGIQHTLSEWKPGEDSHGIELVRIIDHYGGPEVYVSNVVSAIIAVSTK